MKRIYLRVLEILGLRESAKKIVKERLMKLRDGELKQGYRKVGKGLGE